ncbi:MAG TPA: Minf_1886 family protein [Candidatus Omnitrophota bacterium]|nr:Minf_1886 family protein [Candidatus Omnitrophota bacterium]
MSQDFETIVETILVKDSRYKIDAYLFVMEALSFTQRKFKSQSHVTGEEILTGMRDLLLNKYGPMTMVVLKYWGIKTTEDFGHIIFNLVERKILSKTEDDNIESFRDAYSFEEVFREGYRQQLAKKISRMRSI